jgi:hypothetical protein
MARGLNFLWFSSGSTDTEHIVETTIIFCVNASQAVNTTKFYDNSFGLV